MMLIYVTVCDNEGRDASVLLDISRLAAVAPYTEPSPRPSFYSLGSDDSHRPRNRNYLEVWIGTNKWVVLASEWPRIKAALVRVNGGGFNRFGNDTEELECPQYLQTSATGTTAREEATDLSRVTNGMLAAMLRRNPSAEATAIGIDTGTETTICSSSR